MLRMLPVEKPEQLVTLYRTGGWGKGYASYPLYLEFRKHTDLFAGVFARSCADKVRFDARPRQSRRIRAARVRHRQLLRCAGSAARPSGGSSRTRTTARRRAIRWWC